MAIEKCLLPSEAGKILGVSGQTASRWAKEGRLKYYETDGGQVRFRKKDLEEYLENPTASKQILTSTDAASILNATPQTVARWGKEGRIKCHMVGREVRFNREDVESYKRKLENEAAKKEAAREQKKNSRKRRELTPLQIKLRDQMKRNVSERIEACHREENLFTDAFDQEELAEILPGRKLLWVVFFYGDTIPQEALVSPNELTIDTKNRVVHLREKYERRFRSVRFERIYGVK